ncbi:MAG TPA: VWA domain-containing protein [Pyrinomonadaceae bacterium]|nr:VWA domain-containing protein [Pyrinomonadaceae bacterium]
MSKALLLFALLLVTNAAFAQQSRPSPGPTSSPTPNRAAEQEDPVRVFTEEVRLPVMAVDQYGHYDPTLGPDDVLILEDGVAQQVRSVRHIPANVVLVLDTGGELSGLGGQTKRTNLTRDTAVALLSQLSKDTSVAVLQFNNSVEVLQPWTTDRAAILHTLRKRLSSGKRARFSEAVARAAEVLKERPEGTRHVVFITDGVDTPGGKIDRSQAFKKLASSRATVHIISYTEFVRQVKEENRKLNTRQMPNQSDPIRTMDPTQPPGTTRSPSFGVGVRFDPPMRRQRKAYEAQLKNSQRILTELADETGGRIYLPITDAQMVAQARDAAKEIGSEYVVTYRPKRPLANAKQGEYRNIEVAPRRTGLTLRSRRGYVVPEPSSQN